MAGRATAAADQVLKVREAAEFLGISRATLDRIHASRLPRCRLSPGRVGYRLSDLRAYLRRPDDQPRSLAASCNVAVLVMDGETIGPRAPLFDDSGITRLLVRRRPEGDNFPTAVHLPPARQVRGELIVIDADECIGLSSPLELVAAGGEAIKGAASLRIVRRGSTTRLVTLLGGGNEPDGWWEV